MAKHTHEYVPDDDGYYVCSCGAVTEMSVADARALWSDEESNPNTQSERG